jgi:hypothetical protein
VDKEFEQSPGDGHDLVTGTWVELLDHIESVLPDAVPKRQVIEVTGEVDAFTGEGEEMHGLELVKGPGDGREGDLWHESLDVGQLKSLGLVVVGLVGFQGRTPELDLVGSEVDTEGEWAYDLFFESGPQDEAL